MDCVQCKAKTVALLKLISSFIKDKLDELEREEIKNVPDQSNNG